VKEDAKEKKVLEEKEKEIAKGKMIEEQKIQDGKKK
jgi:hypothetical protein